MIIITLCNNLMEQLTTVYERWNVDKTCNISGTTDHLQMCICLYVCVCVFHSLSGKQSSSQSQFLLYVEDV